jgi:hypothetical protein
MKLIELDNKIYSNSSMESFFIETKNREILELKLHYPFDLKEIVVYINGEIAPDGVYEFLKDNNKITVRNGNIV